MKKVADFMLSKCIKNGHFKIIRFRPIDTLIYLFMTNLSSDGAVRFLK